MIRRRIYEELQKHLGRKEITVLIGPRQAGKSTLLKLLQKELHQENVPTLFFNLDVETDNAEFESQAKLINRIKFEFGQKKGVVFIDEIQRKTDAGLFLKGIYDLDIGVKIIVSGSGSLELKEKIAESLAGRKRVFELLPVDFLEFLDYKTEYRYTGRLAAFLQVETEKREWLLNEYMLFGAYPAVITEESKQEKRAMIAEIIQSYLQRDVNLLLPVNHINAYIKLVNILAQQTANPVNYHQLSQYVNISANTVKDYLWYLQKTFIIRESLPFFTNKLKEIVKTPCSYFVDLGLCNYLRNNLYEDYNTPAFGFVFQNLVFNTLYSIFLKDNCSLKFWRTKDSAEVDIVIDYPGRTTPAEVKYTALKKPTISRSLRSFITTYQPEMAFVITREGSFETKLGNTNIFFTPYFQLFNIRKYFVGVI